MENTEHKQPKIVIAPKGCNKDYLTEGKEYPVTDIWCDYSDTYGFGFKIIDDTDYEIYCSEKEDAFLDGNDWIIKE